MSRGRHCVPGFTLIELLVVIAVVMLLMALLLPVLEGAREAGRRAVCLSQTHQQGLAFTNYADDNRQWYPDFTGNAPTTVGFSAGSSQWSWYPQPMMGPYDYRVRILHYLSSYEAFYCPSSDLKQLIYGCTSNQDMWTGNTSGAGSKQAFVLYAIWIGYVRLPQGPAAVFPQGDGLTYNSPAVITSPPFSFNATAANGAPRNESEVNAKGGPSRVVLSSDTLATEEGPPAFGTWTAPGLMNHARFGPGLNSVYGDGHAAWTRLSAAKLRVTGSYIQWGFWW